MKTIKLVDLIRRNDLKITEWESGIRWHARIDDLWVEGLFGRFKPITKAAIHSPAALAKIARKLSGRRFILMRNGKPEDMYYDRVEYKKGQFNESSALGCIEKIEGPRSGVGWVCLAAVLIGLAGVIYHSITGA